MILHVGSVEVLEALYLVVVVTCTARGSYCSCIISNHLSIDLTFVTMVGEKQSVIVLCELIKLCCDFDLDLSFFSQARKNENKIVETFWHLLDNFAEKTITNDIVENVKIYFASQNYRNLEFYSLPSDFSCGSRELLIAFSWLLSNDHVIRSLLKRKIIQSSLSHEFDLYEKEPNSYIEVKLKSVQDHQNYILSLCGRIDTNLKTIYEYNIKTIDLLDKVRSVSNELSVAEIYHLKQIGNLNAYIQRVKSVNNLLEIYRKWKVNESNYWQFMLSVLEIKKQRNKELEVDRTNLMSFFSSLRGYVRKIIKDEQKNMQVIHDKFFPRCVLSRKSSSCVSAVKNLENYLKSAQDEEQQNLKAVYKFLKNLF